MKKPVDSTVSFNFENMDLAQLNAIQKELSAAINLKKRESIKIAYTEAEGIAKSLDLTLDELVAFGGKKRKKNEAAKVKPKYQHPTDNSLVWSGRGRKPLWVVSYLDEGHSLESLAIRS